MGTMRAAVISSCKVVRELGEFVDVALDAIDKAVELREDFINVGGDFRHASAREC